MFACLAGGLALVLAMGVTTMNRRAAESRQVEPPAPRVVVRAPVYETPEPIGDPAPRPKHPLDALTRTVEDVRKRPPGIKRMTRGPAFESARVDALAELSDARETLGAYLDKHPGDDRGHRLWDRLLALYVALKKI